MRMPGGKFSTRCPPIVLNLSAEIAKSFLNYFFAHFHNAKSPMPTPEKELLVTTVCKRRPGNTKCDGHRPPLQIFAVLACRGIVLLPSVHP